MQRVNILEHYRRVLSTQKSASLDMENRWEFFDIKFTRQGFENACGIASDSTCILEAEPGKLDIKIREPGMLFISLPIVSLFKLAIMT